MRPLKEIRREVEARILSGESKQSIYASFSDAYKRPLVGMQLAQTPSLELRKKYAVLNGVLLGLLGVLTAVKLATASQLLLRQSPMLVPLILVVPALNTLLMWMVAKFRPGAHMMVVIFYTLGLGTLAQGFNPELPRSVLVVNGVVAMLVLVACGLAWFLARRLLPNCTFGLLPKRDTAGNPIF